MKYTKQLININDNPFILFDKWFVEAKQKEIKKSFNFSCKINKTKIKLQDFNFQ